MPSSLTNWKCDIYRLTEEKEHLQQAFESFQMNYANLTKAHKVFVKQLHDADKQLVANMQMIQSLNATRSENKKNSTSSRPLHALWLRWWIPP
jgi:glutamate mutase epsilon subunit